MKTKRSIKQLITFLVIMTFYSFKLMSQPVAIINVGAEQQIGSVISFDGSQSYAYNSKSGENDIFLIKKFLVHLNVGLPHIHIMQIM